MINSILSVLGVIVYIVFSLFISIPILWTCGAIILDFWGII
ncbi:unnamed protein product [marine sediment metagenome]|uniref:Uncharacterized protein n=1 Tax=marine sediment metagenome TaxID=412755 RepID=X1AJ56_9ZZZZ